jgi:hypothetical protein
MRTVRRAVGIRAVRMAEQSDTIARCGIRTSASSQARCPKPMSAARQMGVFRAANTILKGDLMTISVLLGGAGEPSVAS